MKDYLLHDHQYLNKIALSFVSYDCAVKVQRIAKGLINNTFLVTAIPRELFSPFILQAVNTNVFKNPRNIVSNYSVLLRAFNNKKKILNTSTTKEFILPCLLFNYKSKDFFLLDQTIFWRSFEYIGNSKCISEIEKTQDSKEIFKALSLFHLYSSDILVDQLDETIEDFHNTPKYYNNYLLALKLYDKSIHISSLYSRISNLIDYVSLNQFNAFLLENPKSRNQLTLSPIHGDPKIDNFLFEKNRNYVISLIDFDTFQYNYLLFDIADCLRSICNPLGENTTDLDNVTFDLSCFYEALQGYFSNNISTLSKSDLYNIPSSLRVITFELGIRFLTDFLTGNHYFKVDYKSQNLDRAEVQFRLLDSIKLNSLAINQGIKEFDTLV